MTLYELNQAGYAAMPKMAKSKIENAQIKINNWIKSTLKSHSEENIYYMLLNNDLHYYTIFNWCYVDSRIGVSVSDSEDVVREIFAIVKDLGTLKSIEFNDNGAWEFWITSPNTTTNVYYLFDYTKGVIEI